MVEGVEMSAGGEHINMDLQKAPVAPVVESRGEDGEHLHRDWPQGPLAPNVEREIVSEEEEEASAAPPSASALADGAQQQPRGRLDMQSGGVSTNLRTVTWANNCRTRWCVFAHPKCAKWVYAALFLGGIVLAMSARDIEVSAFSNNVNGYSGYNEDRFRLGAESALRVSLAFFGFFTIMFCSTVCTKKVHDCGNFWNSNLGGVLFVKIAMLVGCIFGTHFIPSPFIQYYGTVARFGAWLFLAIQLISFTRMIMSWNQRQQLNPEKCRWLVKAISILLNFGSFGFIFWLLHEHRSNLVELAIVIVTLVLIVLMIIIYLKSEVTASWLAHGVMIAYVVFMGWTVIRSKPQRESEFTTNAKHPKGADWLTITSFVCVVIVTGYSTFSTGEDHDWLQFNEEVPSDDDIPYGFSYFHLVFALGSMYFGMLCVGWNAYQTTQRWRTEFGWWSAVVRAVNGLLAAVLYIWMLRTPFIWNKRKLVLSCSGASWVPHVTFQ